MAYFVRRPRGRWEIRESLATPAGPRARTLASFTILTPEALDRAERAARSAIDRDRLLRVARRAGVPIAQRPGDALSTALLQTLRLGTAVRPGLRRLLHDSLAAASPLPRPVDESLAEWIGTSVEERAAALIDLLGLADRLPKPPRRPLTFPRLAPGRLRG